MKNFEIFFDTHMDTSVVVNNIKTNFKIFDFWPNFFLGNCGITNQVQLNPFKNSIIMR